MASTRATPRSTRCSPSSPERSRGLVQSDNAATESLSRRTSPRRLRLPRVQDTAEPGESPAMDAITTTPIPRNEPVRDYAPGSPERTSLQAALAEMSGQHHELTVTIDGSQHMPAGARFDVVAPHDHAHVLGTGATAGHADAKGAVEAALRAAPAWR